MQKGDELGRFMLAEKSLDASNRPLRLHLFHPGACTDDVLLPQVVTGMESICGGFEYRINCVTTSFDLPLKNFVGLPATLELVGDRGQLRKISGLVMQVSSGDSDGAIASWSSATRWPLWNSV